MYITDHVEISSITTLYQLKEWEVFNSRNHYNCIHHWN